MKNKSYRNLILVLIYRTKGNWTWYQINRELRWRGLGQVDVVSIVDGLTAEGLVQKVVDPKLGSGIPYYRTTVKGDELVHNLINLFGIDRFVSRTENKDEYE